MRVKILLFLFCSLLLAYCKSDEGPVTVKEEHQKLITSDTWILQDLTIDGVDETSKYSGLTLHFTDTGLTAENGLPIWPAASSWSFTDDTGNTITRDGNVQLSIIEITSTRLVIRLQWNTKSFSFGRERSINGEHIFTFVKQ